MLIGEICQSQMPFAMGNKPRNLLTIAQAKHKWQKSSFTSGEKICARCLLMILLLNETVCGQRTIWENKIRKRNRVFFL